MQPTNTQPRIYTPAEEDAIYDLVLIGLEMLEQAGLLQKGEEDKNKAL